MLSLIRLELDVEAIFSSYTLYNLWKTTKIFVLYLDQVHNEPPDADAPDVVVYQGHWSQYMKITVSYEMTK